MKHRILFFVFLFFGISVFFFFRSQGMNEVAAEGCDTIRQEKLFTSIEVSDGDTLWSLADQYMTPGYHSRREFIREVRELNHLTGSTIWSGSQLYIPYYQEVVH
jgi:hypothetical protein